MDVLTGLKPKQPCYIMRYALQKEKFGTIAWKELLGGANGDKEEITDIVHSCNALSLFHTMEKKLFQFPIELHNCYLLW